jgi:hypothetical protein
MTSPLPRFAPSLLRALGLAVLAVALAGPARAEDAGDLNLIYHGSGTVSSNQTSFENKYNWKTKSYESGTANTTVRKPFTGSGYVEISHGTARIKLPKAMVPLLSSDSDGWFAVEGFFMNAGEITGNVRINFLNKPKLRIDRGSGQITLESGFGDFAGQCDKVETDPAKRRF